MKDVLIIVVPIVLLSVLCMKQIHTIIASLAASVLLMICSGMDIYEGLTVTYMEGFVSFIQSWFLMFLYGQVFAKILNISGAADSLARTILNLIGPKNISFALTIVGFLFTCGGISAYVSVFLLVPIGVEMCRRANIPRRFCLAGFTLGSVGAFATPFVPSIQNLLCADLFGTTLGAGGGIALGCMAVFFGLGLLYLKWYESYCAKRGMGFIETEEEEMREEKPAAHFSCALIPLLIPAVLYNVFDFSIEMALFAATCAAAVLNYKHLPHNSEEIKGLLTSSVSEAGDSCFQVCGVVGFGSIIVATSAYTNLTEALLNLNADPLLMALVSTGLLAGAAGSASAGIVLAGPVLQQFATAATAEHIHRLIVLGAVSCDTLPNCGFLYMQAAISKVPVKDSYLPIDFVLSLLLPLLIGILYIAILKLAGIA
ncbi:GntP family permease [Lachnospiraceae bacterium KGMB03038]|nr:GntP family permease [Lachnospiraceae bacterium KGMB03038]